MDMTITFCRETVKTLNRHLQAAFPTGNLPQIKHVSALLMLADQAPVPPITERLSVGRSTVYGWRNAFLLDRFASLHHGKPARRPAKLAPTQKQRLCALVAAGPEAAGYRTGCWHAALLQALIWREFGVLYTVHYVSELLRNLGCSYQKHALSPTTSTRSSARHGCGQSGHGWSRSRDAGGPCCCSGTKPALRSGARWATPGHGAGSNPWSRPLAGAKGTRSLA